MKALYGVAAIFALAFAVMFGRSSSAQDKDTQEKDKQDKYTLQIPGGLAFSEIREYEQWQVVGPSLTEAANVIRVIVANPVMIKAYQEGVPGNGKPFPDGSKIVKLEWKPKKITDPPFSASTPDTVPVPGESTLLPPASWTRLYLRNCWATSSKSVVTSFALRFPSDA